MKILKLRFKNLNSLFGEWQIDFQNPAFVSDGIFVISGPTGAGKSSILDAICLALYGQTPRLGKVRSTNEIMSRQSGECFSELDFETQKGRYRSHWSQYRAYRKSDGALQPPRHEISDLDTGKILTSKISETGKQIEDITGMNFERFTRSIMLAQGSFASFLQAEAKDKGPILEQITSTDIYSRISVKTHERLRSEEDILRELDKERERLLILSDEKEELLKKELKAGIKEGKALEKERDKSRETLNWLEKTGTLQRDLEKLRKEGEEQEKEEIDFKDNKIKLQKALKAERLGGPHTRLDEIRKQNTKEKLALEDKEKELPELSSLKKRYEKEADLSEEKVKEIKEKIRTESELWQKVSILDEKLSENTRLGRESLEKYKENEKKLNTYKEEKLKEEVKLKEKNKKIKDYENYLEKRRVDESLSSDFTGIKEQIKNLEEIKNQIQGKKQTNRELIKEYKKAENLVRENQKNTETYRKDLERVSEEIKKAENFLEEMLQGRLLREYRDKLYALIREQSLLNRIASLEEQRAELKKGETCPLCGSKEHPFTENSPPQISKNEETIKNLDELIKKAEKKENQIKELKEKEKLSDRNFIEAEKQELLNKNIKKHIKEEIKKAALEIERIRTSLKDSYAELNKALLIFNMDKAEKSELSLLLSQLEERKNKWQQTFKEKTEAEKELFHMESKVKQLDALIEDQKIIFQEKERELEKIRKEFKENKEKRRELYEDKDPEIEKKKLELKILEAEKDREKIKESLNKTCQQINTAETQIKNYKKQIEERELKLKELEQDFLKVLLDSGFKDEEDFLSAILPEGIREGLNNKAKELEEKKIDIEARKKDRERELEEEKAKNLEDTDGEELKLKFKNQEESLKKVNSLIANHKLMLRENIRAKKSTREKELKAELQRKEVDRWKKLHSLIGSADGSRFRNFAQGLTFEIMLGHANKQLEKMSERYLLIRDKQEPLELQIIDNYQAGEIRSCRNLSGGESFIVSLALALGLSSMASKNIKVDSLFLDEGFGSLDEEALDTALDTLAGLQHEGKLIGLISHLPALKERIPLHIEISPQSGGKSLISGPGCMKIKSQ